MTDFATTATDRQAVAADVEHLKGALSDYRRIMWRRHSLDYGWNATLVTAGILLAVSVTAAGVFDQAKLAGVLGLAITVVVGLQSAFAFEEKAEFYRLAATEADNLFSRLTIGTKSEAELEKLHEQFLTLRNATAAHLPRGKGMEIVRDLYKNG